MSFKVVGAPCMDSIQQYDKVMEITLQYNMK